MSFTNQTRNQSKSQNKTDFYPFKGYFTPQSERFERSDWYSHIEFPSRNVTTERRFRPAPHRDKSLIARKYGLPISWKGKLVSFLYGRYGPEVQTWAEDKLIRYAIRRLIDDATTVSTKRPTKSEHYPIREKQRRNQTNADPRDKRRYSSRRWNRSRCRNQDLRYGSTCRSKSLLY